MFRFRIRSLHSKLIIAFLILMLIPLSEMAIYGHFFTRSAVSGQALERSIYQVHLQAESIVSSFQQAHGDALYLSALRSLKKLRDLRRENANAEQIALWQSEATQDFLVLSSVRPMYHTLRYIDGQGTERIVVQSDGRTVNAVSDLRDRSSAAYFQNAIRLAPGSVYVSPFGSKPEADSREAPFIHYAIKLPDDDGLVLIDLHAGWILRNLPSNPGEDTWAIIDQDGGYLVYPANFDPAASSLNTRTMLEGKKGSLETDASVVAFDTIYPVAGSPEQFWVIYRETPKSVLYAALSDFYTMALIFINGAIILALMLAFFASQWIARPIIELERKAALFGRGGPAPELVTTPPDDEIGALTRTLSEMAQELERKRNLERRLIERLIRAQEEERKLVAYDLHDGLIQQLVGARFYLTNCHERCPVESCDGIRRGCAALSEAIAEGRRIIEGLRPAVLDDLGLVAALEEVARQNAQTAGWDLTLNIEPLKAEPEKTVSVTLYRITQEALSNIRKHARASHVSLSVRNGSGIEVTVEDDGEGFEMASLNGEGRGLGLTTMQERAALLNGTCEITSAPGSGTRIYIWVPLSPGVPARL